MKKNHLFSDTDSRSSRDEGSVLRSLGMITLIGVAGYALYRNRFKIQELLAENGIETPWMKGDVSEAIQSGASKVKGAISHGVDNARSSLQSSNV
jgi:hypothetical protein